MKKALILLLIISGCRLIDEGNVGIPSGTYAYSAFDDNGSLAVVGELHIDAKPGDTPRSFALEGTWKTRSVGPVKPGLGPQIGEGKLIGAVARDGTFWIDLNPDFRDNNVNLLGVFESRDFEDGDGEWQHVTLVGPRAEGTFVATRER